MVGQAQPAGGSELFFWFLKNMKAQGALPALETGNASCRVAQTDWHASRKTETTSVPTARKIDILIFSLISDLE